MPNPASKRSFDANVKIFEFEIDALMYRTETEREKEPSKYESMVTL